MRTTAKEVDGMFGRVCRAATSAGVDTTDWTLERGSVTYGRAWRIFRRDPRTGALHSCGADDYLGSNQREAYTALYGMARAFEMVQR